MSLKYNGRTVAGAGGGGGSGGISALTSETPTNLNGILIGTESHLDIIALDTTPIEDSTNPVMSSGVYEEFVLRTKSSTLSSAEYAALKSSGQLDNDTVYFITDDYIPIEEEINEAIESAINSATETIWTALNSKSEVIANPTLIGTENELYSIQIDDIKYAIPSGGSIIGNPVSGPSSSTSGHIPVFSNTSGNSLSDGYGVAIAISNDSSSVPRTDIVYNEFEQRLKSYEVTSAQYSAMESAGTLESGAVYFITDDYDDVTSVIISEKNAGFHNSIYRGRYLGNSYTSEQKAMISAGTFDDLYIGDYWTINNINWRIAAFDYWYGFGDTVCTDHHVVIVPDSILYITKYHSSSTVSNGYGSTSIGSRNSTTGVPTGNLSTAYTTACNIFGTDYLLVHRDLIQNGNTQYGVGWKWTPSIIELISETMAYGQQIIGTHIQDIGSCFTQLPLFRINSNLLNCDPFSDAIGWWIKDIHQSSEAAMFLIGGIAGSLGVTSECGVRPVFGIKG